MKNDRKFEKLEDGIYRLCVPFHDIYTSVFLLMGEGGCALVDSGTTDADVKKFILPALAEMGASPDYFICSHFHSDHSGGLEFLTADFPAARAVCFDENRNPTKNTVHPKDGDVILGRYGLLNLSGHTADSLAVLDIKTKTLITCDSLQMYGVSEWGTGVDDFSAYLETLARVKSLDISRIIAAHDYYPLGYSAIGDAEIDLFLCECKNAVDALSEFAEANPELDFDELAELYGKKKTELPKISSGIFKKIKGTL